MFIRIGAVLCLVVSVVCVLPVMAAAGAPSFSKMDIKLAHAMATETSSHQGTMKFAELVKQRTGWAVNVQVFPAGQLGGDNDLLDQLKNSIIQAMALGGPALAGFRAWEPLGVFTLPFPERIGTSDAGRHPADGHACHHHGRDPARDHDAH
jgi:TRAP-type C4-dicarboxylate transport system substrate-binding protein